MKKSPQCNLCSEPATVFVSMVIGKEVTQVCYCKKHATQKGILNTQGYDLADINEQIVKSLMKVKKGPICPHCGCGLDDCEQTGLMGCVQCYSTFKHLIQGSLKHIHKRSIHLGKMPTRLDDEVRRLRLELLESTLKRMIDEERYEDAAKIRDVVNLTKGLGDI